jgi:uncharacterized protein YbjT (DUF2867 family)
VNIIVFGASKGVGRQVVQQALEKGHTVTAFARNPNLVPHPNLSVVQGDALDADAVSQAMTGFDAVICALGSGNTNEARVRSTGTTNIVAAMRAKGIKRLVAVSSFAVGDSRKGLVAAIAWFFLRAALEEHERQETVIRTSGLSWTIVRPTGLTDDPATGKIRVGTSGRGRIPRADVAAFVLNQLIDDSGIGKAITISS